MDSGEPSAYTLNNLDDREYSEGADQIREVLIHAHYLSQKSIEI